MWRGTPPRSDSEVYKVVVSLPSQGSADDDGGDVGYPAADIEALGLCKAWNAVQHVEAEVVP